MNYHLIANVAHRVILSLALFSLPLSSSLAEAGIPIKYRVKNQWPGYCCWASIETVCRHQGIEAGYNLVEKRKLDNDYITWDGRIIAKNYGADDPIADKMKSLGIKFLMNPTSHTTKDAVLQIKKAVHEGKGAVIIVYHGLPTVNECHAVVVIDMNDKTYSYIDSNNPTAIYDGDISWFWQEWTGFVLTLSK